MKRLVRKTVVCLLLGMCGSLSYAIWRLQNVELKGAQTGLQKFDPNVGLYADENYWWGHRYIVVLRFSERELARYPDTQTGSLDTWIAASANHAELAEDETLYLKGSGYPINSVYLARVVGPAWPWSERYLNSFDVGASGSLYLPFVFRPAPLIVNALAWACATAAMGAAIASVRTRHRRFRQARRQQAGLCPACSYPRRGQHRCPECGAATTGQ